MIIKDKPIKYIKSEQKPINETGNRYGKLVVIKMIAKGNGQKTGKWLCQCDCGNSYTVRSQNLRNGYKYQCSDCDKDEKIIAKKEAICETPRG